MTSIPLPAAELKSALNGLSKIIDRHASLPELQMIHIERTKDGWLCLTTTDLDRFVTVRLEQPSPGDPVSMLVPLLELQRLVKACNKSETLQLTPANDKDVIVRFDVGGHSGEQRLPSLPVSVFPAIPKVRGPALTLPDHVRTSLHEAMACASTDETHYVLNGTFIDATKADANYLVATDGRHLYSSNSFSLPFKSSLNIPKHKFLGWREFNLDGEWQLKLGEPSQKDEPPLVQISSRRWRFITKQIGGNYPAWQQVVPDAKHTRCVLRLDESKIPEILRLIELLPCHDDKFRTIGLCWREGRLSVMAKEKTFSEWLSRPVPLLKGDGPNMTVFCNRVLLVKALQFGLNTIHLIDKVSPLKFTCGGKQMIVMPIREEAADPVKPPQSASPPPRPRPTEVPPVPGPPSCVADSSPANDPYEEAHQQLHVLRDSLRGSLQAVTSLSSTLKQLRADQRNITRDLHTLRSSLRHLQKVPLR
jgi:hypothetical protein